jgi:hypothetical protein
VKLKPYATLVEALRVAFSDAGSIPAASTKLREYSTYRWEIQPDPLFVWMVSNYYFIPKKWNQYTPLLVGRPDQFLAL